MHNFVLILKWKTSKTQLKRTVPHQLELALLS